MTTGNAADAVDVVHDVTAEWLQVPQVRNLLTDPGEVLQRQVHVGLPGDGKQVKDGVGGSSEGHDDCDGVLECGLGHDLASGDALAQHLHHSLARAVRVTVPAPIHRRRRGRARQRHTEGLGNRRHGVGRVHASAGSLARADRALDAVDLVACDEATKAGADGLEGVDDRHVLAVDLAWHDRAGVQEDAGKVEPRGGHEHARQALVAASQQHGAVHALGHHHCLDGVGDDLPGHEREVHALMAHRDAVGDRDGSELHREAACRVHALLHGVSEPG
jgi:hypothetical protein